MMKSQGGESHEQKEKIRSGGGSFLAPGEVPDKGMEGQEG